MRHPYIESATALYDYYDEQIIRKCHFDRPLFCDFYYADDHLKVTLVFKSAAPCRCISN